MKHYDTYANKMKTIIDSVHGVVIEDGSDGVVVVSPVSFGSTITSSVGSFGVMSTIDNNQTGQTLGTPGAFVQVVQWLTSSISTAGVMPSPTGSVTINQEGLYYTSIGMSFSGSAGTYTFSLFQNGVQHPNCQLQTTINTGQSFPRPITLTDLNYYHANDTLDVRVKRTNNNAGFQLNNGNFCIFRVVN